MVIAAVVVVAAVVAVVVDLCFLVGGRADGERATAAVGRRVAVAVAVAVAVPLVVRNAVEPLLGGD